MNLKRLTIWLLLVVWASGCTTPVLPATLTPTATLSGTFAPYHTPIPSITLSPSQAPLELASATALPTITATPRTHVVKAGEDMGGIALRYRVPLKDLIAANPTVNPRLMKVGTVLVVPGAAALPTAAAGPSATQQPVRLEPARCLADPAGGSWCFVKVFNQSGAALINVTVLVRLADAGGNEVARQNAAMPLDLLPSGGMLPLAVYFSVPLPQGAQAGVQLVSALPATSAGNRYPVVRFSRRQIDISADGLSAVAGGQVELTGDKTQPAFLAVLAVAYTDGGSLTALRLWQSPQTLQAGKPLDFQVRLYALGGAIRQVELFAEARYGQ